MSIIFKIDPAQVLQINLNSVIWGNFFKQQNLKAALGNRKKKTASFVGTTDWEMSPLQHL